MESHLLQMRGLKHRVMLLTSCCLWVASFTDAWIETVKTGKYLMVSPSHLLQMRGLKLHNGSCRISHSVASFTDAWIETSKHIGTGPDDESHLLQMRGLKRQKMLR